MNNEQIVFLQTLGGILLACAMAGTLGWFMGRDNGYSKGNFRGWEDADKHYGSEIHNYKEYRARISKQLASPPPGWFVLGSHIDQPDIQLEFWGDDGGVPIWERPTPPTSSTTKTVSNLNLHVKSDSAG